MKYILKSFRVLFVVTLFVVIPLSAFFYILKLPESPDASCFAGVEFACKGGHHFGPENTLSTIITSVEKDAKAIEIDVQITADNILVVFLDDTMGRTTNGKGAIDTMTFLELQSFYILNKDGSISSEKISTLEEIIKYAKPKGLLIDINFNYQVNRKKEATEKISEIFENYNLYECAYISSIDHRILYRIRKMNPEIITALIMKPNVSGLRFLDNFHRSQQLARFIGAGIIKPEFNLLKKRFIRKWKRKNFVINAQKVNSAAMKDKFLKNNISITTKCPGCCCEKLLN